MNEADAAWMRQALALAEQGRRSTHPNPRVGCVLVRAGICVGEGAHLMAGAPHAEVHALRAAGEAARGATAYVTLEPCSHHGRTPPCADALIAAGIARVVIASEDPNPLVAGRGITALRAAGIEVVTGVEAVAADRLNRGFFLRMRAARPWVSLKLAASLDGRTAMASGESQWITGEAARADVHRLRAEAGAVLVGAGTVLHDDPALTVRHGHTPRPPDRIVWDSRARVRGSARVWNGSDGARRFWLTADHGPAPEGVTRLVVATGADRHLKSESVLATLAAQDVNEVLVEAGPQLAGALLRDRMVDELIVYLAPRLLGDQARGLASLPGLETLAGTPQFLFSEVTPVGVDLRLRLTPEEACLPASSNHAVR